MRDRFDKALNLCLVVAAVAVAFAALRMSFLGPEAQRPARPEYVSGWEEGIQIGRPIAGDSSRPIQIITMLDLECPSCARFHSTLQALAEERPDEVGLYYVHFPLPYHRHASLAAKGAECAAAVGRFGPWIDQVLMRQDSLGLIPWEQLAREAEVEDTDAFVRCIWADTAWRRIDMGLAYGQAMGLKGTPTAIVNGWRLPDVPTLSVLDSVIDAQLPSGGRRARNAKR